MKILKLGIFSLLTIFAVSIFLTSCEQQEMLDETLTDIPSENLLTVVEGEEFILPYGYDKLSEEAKDEYLNSLDSESFAKLVESNKVATYFAYLGKYEMLKSSAKYGDIFDQNTLASYLTADEAEGFSSTDFASIIELRGCGSWFTIVSCRWTTVYDSHCNCTYRKKQKKLKRECDWWFDQYKWVNC